MLTREEILAQKDRRTIEPLDVPEWGGQVFVRSLLGTEMDAFEQACADAKQGKNKIDLRTLKARLVVLTACNQDGSALFTKADVPGLNAGPAAALNRVYKVAQRLNHLDDKDVEDLAKNSESGPGDDTGSV